MLGLGETGEEVLQVMRDLRAHQRGYFDAGPVSAAVAKHLPIVRYVSPEEFAGSSGPDVRWDSRMWRRVRWCGVLITRATRFRG